MTYETYRATFDDAEQAARNAYEVAVQRKADIETLQQELREQEAMGNGWHKRWKEASFKLEKCEAERAKYERWFYAKFGDAFERGEHIDELLESNRELSSRLEKGKALLDQWEEAIEQGLGLSREEGIAKLREALSDE